MVKASKGIMEKTRQQFRRSPRDRGLSPITRSFQTFVDGERVTIVIDSSVQRGWPHHRFHGMTGTVVGRRGGSFLVDVRFGGKIKQELMEIPMMSPFNAVKIVDLMPTHMDDVRAIFAKERFALSKEDAEKVLEIV